MSVQPDLWFIGNLTQCTFVKLSVFLKFPNQDFWNHFSEFQNNFSLLNSKIHLISKTMFAKVLDRSKSIHWANFKAMQPKFLYNTLPSKPCLKGNFQNNLILQQNFTPWLVKNVQNYVVCYGQFYKLQPLHMEGAFAKFPIKEIPPLCWFF